MILPMLFAIVGFAVTTIFGAAQAQPVRISYGGTSGYNVPIWVTQDAGLFNKYGLNTELIFISGAAAGTHPASVSAACAPRPGTHTSWAWLRCDECARCDG